MQCRCFNPLIQKMLPSESSSIVGAEKYAQEDETLVVGYDEDNDMNHHVAHISAILCFLSNASIA